MSVSDRRATPEALAFRELEQLVRHLVDELAGFRRRALTAEGRLRELEIATNRVPTEPEVDHTGAGLESPNGERVLALQSENEQLRARLASATDRTRKVLDRVRFLRQQHGNGSDR